MTTREKVQELLRQATDLPEEAQVDFIESLVEMRSRQTGVYHHLDDDERRALAESAEDERSGRFASEEEIEATFARYGA
jgi:hypothetical protein